MERVIKDKSVYGNMLIDELIGIKDRNRDTLTMSEVDAINDACNFIEEYIQEIKKQ